MTALAYFTVVSTALSSIDVDYIDSGTDPDENVIYSFVDFVPREAPGTVHWLIGLTPPRGIQLDTIRGRYSPEDGQLRTIIGAPTNEKQLVTVTGDPFTLTYAGQTTGNIAQTATPPTVQAALEALSNIAVGDVYVSGVMVNEKQTLTRTGSPTGGTFIVHLDGVDSTAIGYNASASTVQAILQAMSNIGHDGCSVTGPTGGPWVVEFTETLAGANVDTMTVTNSFTPSGGITVSTTVTGSTGNPFTVNFQGTLAATDVAQMTATNATVSTLKAGSAVLGVELVANTAVMQMDSLIYDVIFTIPDLDTTDGVPPRTINPFAILAPTTGGVTVDLADASLHLPPKGA